MRTPGHRQWFHMFSFSERLTNFVGCSCILHSQPPNIRPALLATPLLRALPTHVSTVTVIVLSDLVFYCDHFPEIWEPRRFFSVEIQWFNMGAPKNN